MSFENFNKAPDTSATGTSLNPNYNENYCINRLPCGYCQILNRQCPMMYGMPTITWKVPEITCGADA